MVRCRGWPSTRNRLVIGIHTHEREARTSMSTSVRGRDGSPTWRTTTGLVGDNAADCRAAMFVSGAHRIARRECRQKFCTDLQSGHSSQHKQSLAWCQLQQLKAHIPKREVVLLHPEMSHDSNRAQHQKHSKPEAPPVRAAGRQQVVPGSV